VVLEKLRHYISRPRVARLMKANGLFARRKRKFKTTTDSNHRYPIAPNILNRNFKVSKSNQIWVADCKKRSKRTTENGFF
jgi:transposase InsO family protein